MLVLFTRYTKRRENEAQFSGGDSWRKVAASGDDIRAASMAFNVATNNRFDLFVDDDNVEDADELLTRQQRQARGY